MLSVLGFIAVIISTYYVYKTAKDNGRNAIVWALITFGVGVGIQIIIPVLIGFGIGLIMAASGSSIPEIQQSVQSVAIVISLVCLVLSFIGIALIMRYVARIPEEGSFVPPPPDFSNEN